MEVGPQQVAQIELRHSVDPTDARNALPVGRERASLDKTPPVRHEARIITLTPAAREAPFCNPVRCPCS